MRVVAIYREHSDYGRSVEEFIEDVRMKTGKTIESIDPDDTRNENFLISHDVVEYPTVMAINDSGAIIDEWRGRELPSLELVLPYVNEILDEGFFDEGGIVQKKSEMKIEPLA